MTRLTFSKIATDFWGRIRLHNEAWVYRLLSHIPAHTSGGWRFHLPKLMADGPGRLVVGHVSARPAVAATLLVASLAYLTWLNGRLTDSDKRFFLRRGPWFYLLTYPYFFLRALFFHPQLVVVLWRSFLTYFSLLPALVSQRPDVLAHRDLGLDNILVSGREAYLIDWEYAAVTVPLYDLAYAVVYTKSGAGRKRWQLLGRVKVQSPALLRGLGIYIATQALSVALPARKFSQYRDCLVKFTEAKVCA